MATKKERGEYMETVIKLRDFLFDYSWLFNFSNIDIIKLDLVKTVSTFNNIRQLRHIILKFTATFFINNLLFFNIDIAQGLARVYFKIFISDRAKAGLTTRHWR